jgi:hypothetical protein
MKTLSDPAAAGPLPGSVAFPFLLEPAILSILRAGILIFYSRLSAHRNREELDPKFLFVELYQSVHNRLYQFAGVGDDGCRK